MATPTVTYDSSRTYLVDSRNNSYLFRGNEPLASDGSFATEELLSDMKRLTGKDLSNHKLIDISLIDDVAEKNDLTLEFTAYGIDFEKEFPGYPWPPVAEGYHMEKRYGCSVGGHPGSIIWYPVQGCIDCSNCDDVEESLYSFKELVVYLDSLLNSNKVLVYYHCEHGHDRTSALSACYMMKYLKKSLSDVLEKAPPEGAKSFTHPWEVNYKQLVEWYAS